MLLSDQPFGDPAVQCFDLGPMPGEATLLRCHAALFGRQQTDADLRPRVGLFVLGSPSFDGGESVVQLFDDLEVFFGVGVGAVLTPQPRPAVADLLVVVVESLRQPEVDLAPLTPGQAEIARR